jgi:hypothetical protein
MCCLHLQGKELGQLYQESCDDGGHVTQEVGDEKNPVLYKWTLDSERSLQGENLSFVTCGKWNAEKR